MSSRNAPTDEQLARDLETYLGLRTDIPVPRSIEQIRATDLDRHRRGWRFIAGGLLTTAAVTAVVIAGLMGHHPVANREVGGAGPRPSGSPSATISPGATPTPTPGPPAGWLRYSNSTGRYSFWYPPTWKVTTCSPASGGVLPEFTVRAVPPDLIAVTIDPCSVNDNFIGLQGLGYPASTYHTGDAPPCPQQKVVPITVAGVTGLNYLPPSVPNSCSYPDTPLAYGFLTGGYEYTLAWNGPLNDTDARVFDQIMQTWSFTA